MNAKTLRWTLTLVALIVLVGGSSANAQRHSARPNIIFVLTDDLAWNLVDYMPHVRQMQADGTTFENYFVTDSLCCPSRASIFTGRYPHDTGIFTNSGGDGGFAAFHARGEERETFATNLQTRGYLTSHAPYTPAPRHANDFPGLQAPRTPAFNEADMSDKPPWLSGHASLTDAQIAQIDAVARKRAQTVEAVDEMIANLQARSFATGWPTTRTSSSAPTTATTWATTG